MGETEIGRITHYFSKIGVAALEITSGELKVGDTIHVKGHTSDFTTTIQSMQIEHEQVQVAKVGDSIGIKVPDHAREHDQVFLVTPE
jgi:translation elongation factor EF-1alpha